jgi:AcrR family transcriptional regulator
MAAKAGSGRSQTRERVLEAVVVTLATQGFSRTTARAVAATGGFAPGVIYYHFEDLDDLFVATAHYTSTERLTRYRERTAGVNGVVQLIDRLRELYREDQSSGHVAAVQELVAAAASSPRLAEQVRQQGEQWQAVAEELIRGQIRGQMFEMLVPVRELATAAVGAYLGLEMLSHLNASPVTPEALFDAALPAAALIDAFRRALCLRRPWADDDGERR